MRLHEDKALFAEVILRASQPKENGGIGVNAGFIEKDYWITRALQQMSRSAAKDVAVFKGGTSLSKVYGIGARFSEDVDVAIVRSDGMTDAGLKTIIRSTEKAMADGLTPIERPGLTSKGSRYRKSYFLYPQVEGIAPIGSMIPGQLLIEINSFANPYPFGKYAVRSFILSYLQQNGLYDIISEFDLRKFSINVLDKRTTMTEKLVSLLRFSLGDNPITDLTAKIRHFYDIHYLVNDSDCRTHLGSCEFIENFTSLIEHDRVMFAKPDRWQTRSISDSPLLKDFDAVWRTLSQRYSLELPSLAYSTIPVPEEIAESMKYVLGIIKANGAVK